MTTQQHSVEHLLLNHVLTVLELVLGAIFGVRQFLQVPSNVGIQESKSIRTRYGHLGLLVLLQIVDLLTDVHPTTRAGGTYDGILGVLLADHLEDGSTICALQDLARVLASLAAREDARIRPHTLEAHWEEVVLRVVVQRRYDATQIEEFEAGID